ncbi:MAG: exodeoxyribonuclease VII large subunit [Bacteroidales bacterium]|jgi:exodeoxyribonuclease VII large subunit|nr:exodeoxyribonuclease VII large subunit [Bacteroidales bacterium]
MINIDKLTLAELQLIIRDSIYLALPEMYWVIAEISEMKENYNGHCYLELIEKQPDDRNIRARARAVIWSSRYRFLKSFFENVAGESLREGLKVLVKVKVEYHEIYGLSLVISDIDPSFTMGDLAVKRQMILKRLEEDGVLSMNRELEFPLFPQRIAVISSRNAAGYTDFIKHISENSYGYVFYTALFEAAMQGNETETSIIGALDRIAEKIGFFDVIVIIRGGGSQTDLSWFDNYNIAYYITQFPLPVLTGIGHEKDLSVTDIVAYKALKTPTAVADFLINCANEAENNLTETVSGIISLTRNIILDHKHKVETFSMKINPLARIMISGMKEKLSSLIIETINSGKESVMKAGLIPANHKSRLASSSKSLLSASNNKLAGLRNGLVNETSGLLRKSGMHIEGLTGSLKILDPVNVLKRGFTITSLNGVIVKSKEALKSEDEIDTHFVDGSVKSRVEGI